VARFEFESGIVLFFFIFSSFGESRLLVLWCAEGMCDMTCSDEDRGMSRRPGAEDRRWSQRCVHNLLLLFFLGDNEVKTSVFLEHVVLPKFSA
jgi:hypothetical protein